MFRTRFGSLELTIRSLESEKIIMGSLESGEFGPLQLNTGYLTFSLKKTGLTMSNSCHGLNLVQVNYMQ